MTDIDPHVLLAQLARYTANGALNSQYSLPVLGRLAGTTPLLNGEQLIEALLRHGDPAVAGMIPRVQAARHSEAARLHAARRDKRLSVTETPAEQFPLLTDLPLDALLGWATLAHSLKVWRVLCRWHATLDLPQTVKAMLLKPQRGSKRNSWKNCPIQTVGCFHVIAASFEQ